MAVRQSALQKQINKATGVNNSYGTRNSAGKFVTHEQRRNEIRQAFGLSPT